MISSQPAHTQLAVIIRQVQLADLPALEWGGEYTHFRRLYAEAFRQMVNGDALLWMAETQNKGLVAQVFVQLNSQRTDLADGRLRAYIYGFRVKPEYRRRGVGTRLMNYIERDLQKRGYGYANLNVGQDNPGALRLYERLGYSVIGPDPGVWSYIDHQGTRHTVNEPAWRMEKCLR